MWRTILSLMIGGTVMFLISSQITVGQQAPVIKRTDLLKTALPEMEGKDMNVWVADIPPSASTGLHSHPTPRFVYVIEGAVVYEVDGKQPQTFKTGEAYVEMPGEVHNFRNASTTQPARALGFQYANKGQPLQNQRSLEPIFAKARRRQVTRVGQLPLWVMYGRCPRSKRNLTISEAFGCGHVFGL
jgi:quercetin dioxygenase-like cupin family protein